MTATLKPHMLSGQSIKMSQFIASKVDLPVVLRSAADWIEKTQPIVADVTTAIDDQDVNVTVYYISKAE